MKLRDLIHIASGNANVSFYSVNEHYVSDIDDSTEDFAWMLVIDSGTVIAMCARDGDSYDYIASRGRIEPHEHEEETLTLWIGHEQSANWMFGSSMKCENAAHTELLEEFRSALVDYCSDDLGDGNYFNWFFVYDREFVL
jgi:hypothetical protein